MFDEKENDQIECCICQSSNKQDPLGVVVRFCETGGKRSLIILIDRCDRWID